MVMTHPLIETHGKELISDLLDMVVIQGKITNAQAYNLCLKHKLITRRTKSIYADVQYSTFANRYKIRFASASKKVLRVNIYKNEIPQLLEELGG